jgi:hypothetical protein
MENHVKSLVTRKGSKPGGTIRQYVDFEFYNYSLSTFL